MNQTPTKSKHQVIFIRGGDTFENKEDMYAYLKKLDYHPHIQKRTWRDWLEWSLSETFDAYTPLMPNKQWVDYKAWSIWFEKVLEHINPDPELKFILIGQSVGGLFLAKYLSEHKLPKKMDQFHLVSPMFNNEGMKNGEKAGTLTLNTTLLKKIPLQAKKMFLYHSTDDHVVPFKHSLEYMKFFSDAQFFSFNNRGHFAQPAFMEILEVINKNLNE